MSQMSQDNASQAEFRTQVAAWMQDNRPADPGFLLPQTFMEVGSERVLEFLREWQHKVWSAGYLGAAWPKKYGGQGMSRDYQRIADEEMKRLQVPICFNVIGLGWAGPLILDNGSDYEKEKYLKEWLGYSGVSFQITYKKKDMTDIEKCEINVTVGNGQKMKCELKGLVSMKMQ